MEKDSSGSLPGEFVCRSLPAAGVVCRLFSPAVQQLQDLEPYMEGEDALVPLVPGESLEQTRRQLLAQRGKEAQAEREQQAKDRMDFEAFREGDAMQPVANALPVVAAYADMFKPLRVAPPASSSTILAVEAVPMDAAKGRPGNSIETARRICWRVPG